MQRFAKLRIKARVGILGRKSPVCAGALETETKSSQRALSGLLRGIEAVNGLRRGCGFVVPLLCVSVVLILFMAGSTSLSYRTPATVQTVIRQSSGNTSSLSIAQTLVLENNTLIPGNFRASNLIFPVAMAVIDLSTATLVRTVGMGARSGGTSITGDNLGIVYDPANGHLYVTNYTYSSSGGDVAVIDAATQRIVASIPLGSPTGITYDGANGHVYVALSYSNSVAVIDGATDRLIGTVPTGFGPQRIAYDSGNGDLYVTNGGSGSVTVIDGSTDQAIANILLGPGARPSGIAYDSANGHLYVTNGPNVTVIDGATDRIVGNIPVGLGPLSIAYDGANGRLYVSAWQSSNMSVIDGATNRVIANVTVGLQATAIVWDSGNGYLYVSNNRGFNVTVIDGATNRVAANIPIAYGGCCGWPAYDAANGHVYVPSDGRVAVIGDATNREVGNVTLGFGGDGIAWDRTTGYLYLTSSGSGNVYVMNRGSGTISMTKNPRAAPGGPGGTPVPGFPANVGYALIGAIIVVIVAGATLAFVGLKRKRTTRPRAPPPPTAPPQPP